ncbi:hypothetical protein GPECTOR_39g500 [Gonium pectorale]|uniref:Ubiquitin-like domain-containing protein n=1 Tax=Gonium pectorale TaxID=33097 RepID=A0A150GAY3_GONPE|nr:hypothetical protein GPECTOR_39g500 [Gonium pectorale]|eukprot:KXZ47006.1 hypothetical protein GPECTOR_39g500 [Gonium pectorale]
MELSTADLESSRQAARSEREREVQQEEGGDVKLVITLPGGEKLNQSFKTGVTVAYVKALVAQQAGLDFGKLRLLLGGKPLIDPLSLADCPGIEPGREVAVEVALV